MEKEIELKLLLPDGIDESDLLSTLGQFSANIETSEFTLFNQYFDTPEWLLSANGIGLRVRSSDKGIEQTVKTAGKSIGGLHQRPEYNVSIDSLSPSLELFDPSIWPRDISVAELQEKIIQIFHTDFKRKAYLLRLSDGTDVELVLDKGSVSTADNSADICEIELELKSGDVAVLFDIAEKMATLAPSQLCNLSKAGRGFTLARNALAPEPQKISSVTLSDSDDCESGFIKGLGYALSFWQKAEYRYMQTKKVTDLIDIYVGLRLTRDCVHIYSKALQCKAIEDLSRALNLRLNKWAWIEQLKSIRALRSKRGMYSKRLAQHDALVSYLRGLQDGTLNLSRPHYLITHQDNSLLQLGLSRLLVTCPWRQKSDAHTKPLKEHAEAVLQQKWQSVLAGINADVGSMEEYLQHYEQLLSALNTDLLLGSCLDNYRRQPFLDPWSDVLEGIQELRKLNVFQTKLLDSDVEDKSELLQWSEVKKNSLLTVIELSKGVAMSMETYW
ncbi:MULTISPECIES: CYTH domain-containing protein [Alteromonadaceae]|uniref:CYTH domain-containing protein n=1 Tax=Alteromonadaceae TaxID=72275 RepID=UPI003106EB41